jgi:cation diffusion facilitator family transporter
VAKKTDSPALEAITYNIAADAYSAAGVLVGLAVLRLTGIDIIDPALALAVSVIIIWSACKVMRKSFGGLMDVRLPEDEENTIRFIISSYGEKVTSFDSLRTRKAGSQRHISFNLTMGSDTSLEEVHTICDCIEQDIEAGLPNSTVTIHVEPADKESG